MKRYTALLLLILCFFFTGCEKTVEEPPVIPTEVQTEPPVVYEKAEEINISLGEIYSIDPAKTVSYDDITVVSHVFSGLAKWDTDGRTIVPDCAKALPEGVVNEDGTVTYTYILRDDIYWSDGVRVTANDFVYAWKRAATRGSEYSYMFETVAGYDKGELEVTALNDTTLSVKLSKYVPYWNELLTFHAYMPVREDVVTNPEWEYAAETIITNGPYTVENWVRDNVIVLEKNEGYYNAKNVTMPKINCYLTGGYEEFAAGDRQFAEYILQGGFNSVKAEYPEELKIASIPGTYFITWNINEDIIPSADTLTPVEKEAAQAEVRRALSLLLDRAYIAEYVTANGEMPATTLVPFGVTDYNGSQFYENTGESQAYDGYIDLKATEANYAAAMGILKKYYTYDEAVGVFTDAPTLSYIYDEDNTHRNIAEYVKSTLGALGFNVELKNMQWADYINSRLSGEYQLSRYGWIDDINDPLMFLSLWCTQSGNNNIGFGKGEHADTAAYSLDLTPYGYDILVENGTWAETYDVLVSIIENCRDEETRYKLMHKAEDMIMETGCIVPVFYYTDTYLADSNLTGVYTNPAGIKFFMNTEYTVAKQA